MTFLCALRDRDAAGAMADSIADRPRMDHVYGRFRLIKNIGSDRGTTHRNRGRNWRDQTGSAGAWRAKIIYARPI